MPYLSGPGKIPNKLVLDTPQNLDYDEVMTYIAAIAPQSDIYAALDHFDAILPGWDVNEAMGTRYLTERDFPVYDDSADLDRVSNEDWEMFFGSRF